MDWRCIAIEVLGTWRKPTTSWTSRGRRNRQIWMSYIHQEDRDESEMTQNLFAQKVAIRNSLSCSHTMKSPSTRYRRMISSGKTTPSTKKRGCDCMIRCKTASLEKGGRSSCVFISTKRKHWEQTDDRPSEEARSQPNKWSNLSRRCRWCLEAPSLSRRIAAALKRTDRPSKNCIFSAQADPELRQLWTKRNPSDNDQISKYPVMMEGFNKILTRIAFTWISNYHLNNGPSALSQLSEYKSGPRHSFDGNEVWSRLFVTEWQQHFLLIIQCAGRFIAPEKGHLL